MAQRTVEDVAITNEAVKSKLFEAFGYLIEANPRIDEPVGQRAQHTSSEANSCWISDLDNLALLAAVHKRRVDLAKVALLKNANPNKAMLDQRLLPVHVAVEAGDVDMLRLLLDYGASVDAENGVGDTALHVAVKKDLAEVATVLLAHNADVDAVNWEGETPLRIATANGSVNVLAILLEARVLVDTTSTAELRKLLDIVIEKVEVAGSPYMDCVKLLVDHGATLSQWPAQKLVLKCSHAVITGARDLVVLYLNNGCNPNEYIEAERLTLLGVAAKFGRVEIGEVLLDHEASTETEPPALVTAISNNKPHFVDMLLQRKSDVSSLGLDSWQCMQFVALEADLDAEAKKEMIAVLVKNGISVDIAVDRFFNTVLHEATQKNNAEVVQVLVEMEANVNVQNKSGITPLMLACLANSPEVARILVQNGKADLSRTSEDGSHALSQAVEKGHEALVKSLLIEGAPVNLARLDGLTPLDLALRNLKFSEEPHLNVIKVLVDHGATLMHWEPHRLVRECHVAVLNGKKDLVELYLNNRCDPDGREVRTGSTLLEVAAHHGRIEMGKLLLDHGARLEMSWTALVIAMEGNQLRFVDWLLWRGARQAILDKTDKDYIRMATLDLDLSYFERKALIEVLAKNEISVDAVCYALGNSVLHEAAKAGRVDAVGLLVELGANVNVQNKNGVTPPLLACRHGKYEAAKVMIDSGRVDFNRRDNEGSHIFYEAILHRATDFVQYLLNKGAPINLIGEHGFTALEQAVMTSDAVMVRMLLGAGADVSSFDGELLSRTVKKKDFCVLLPLFGAGANVNHTDAEKKSLLHVACECNLKEAVKVLLDAGADVHGSAETVDSPLLIAIRERADEDIIEMLLNAGADVNVADCLGNTLLHMTAMGGLTGAAYMLLQHGANPFILNEDNKDAADVASTLGHKGLARLLEDHKSTMLCEKDDDQRYQPSSSDATPRPDSLAKIIADMKMSFQCPITLETMEDPVMGPDGHTYERSVITAWIENHERSPITQQHMDVTQLVPNFVLKQQIEAFHLEKSP